MDNEEAKRIGGLIHKYLNRTLERKLTTAEYKRLVVLIGKLFETLLTNK